MKAVLRFLAVIAALAVAAVIAAAVGQLFAQTTADARVASSVAVEATVIAPKNCSIRCTLENGKYSFYTSERCLNSLPRKEIDEFNHKCVVRLESEHKRLLQQHTQLQEERRCRSDKAKPPRTPEGREHLKNCDNPLTTDEYYREVTEWYAKDRPTSENEWKERVLEFQRILARERQRQADGKRNRN